MVVKPFLVPIQIVIADRHGKPSLELRKVISDPHIMGTLIKCAYRNTPVIVLPQFTNWASSMHTLIKKEIIVYDDKTGKLHITSKYDPP